MQYLIFIALLLSAITFMGLAIFYSECCESFMEPGGFAKLMVLVAISMAFLFAAASYLDYIPTIDEIRITIKQTKEI